MNFESILKHIGANIGHRIACDYQFARTVIGAPIEEKQLSVKA